MGWRDVVAWIQRHHELPPSEFKVTNSGSSGTPYVTQTPRINPDTGVAYVADVVKYSTPPDSLPGGWVAQGTYYNSDKGAWSNESRGPRDGDVGHVQLRRTVWRPGPKGGGRGSGQRVERGPVWVTWPGSRGRQQVADSSMNTRQFSVWRKQVDESNSHDRTAPAGWSSGGWGGHSEPPTPPGPPPPGYRSWR